MTIAPPAWPELFTASEPPVPVEPAAPDARLRLVDRFAVKLCSWPLDNQWVVTLDDEGTLRALALPARSSLPEGLQLQLSALSVAGNLRVLATRSVYLFALERLESLGDVPGLQDPVAATGRMFGPFALDPEALPAARAAHGRLCAGRVELLDALWRARPFALHAPAPEGSVLGSVCHHLALSTGSLREGAPGPRGPDAALVVAYPLASSGAGALDNSRQSAALAYELLVGLQQDLRRNHPASPLASALIPVPDRAAYQARLASRGYEIHGEFAYPPPAEPRRWLGRLLRSLVRRAQKLPPEGSLSELLQLSRAAIDALPGGPTPRALAARRAVQVLEARWPSPEGFALTPVNNGEAQVLDRDRITVAAPQAAKGGNIVFRVPAEFYLEGSHCPLEFEAELFDVGYGGHVCHVPAYQQSYATPESYRLSGQLDWRSHTWRLPDTNLDGKLWNGDVGLYLHDGQRSGHPFSLRRATVRAVRPPWFDPRSECDGHLDAIVGTDGKNLCEGKHAVVALPEGPLELQLSGWVIDRRRRSAGGRAGVLLRSGAGEHFFACDSRHPRPDIDAQYGAAYEGAGFSGTLSSAGVRPGIYTVILRVFPSDGGEPVEREFWHRISIAGPK